ncbi:DNA polymerase III subunit delta [Mesoplasma lactucae]|uniref:DNA polymerase III subunit delta n=1 Tax=Mesoplasma lactucae TaxID=138853 RepID=UPI000CA11A75|nr:hypothetical protein [Mesoplasma lactucae]ATZ20166.1 DNA polymerase III subunit delta [Mesoplasma lactucae ATCC 49193]MCL8216915.1 putative protein YqeN [Mesoplasma lactucae ATCC 49193]
MYLVYSVDTFLIKKQVNKIVKKELEQNSETEIHEYSWLDSNLNLVLQDVRTRTIFDDPKIIILNDCYFLTDKKLSEKEKKQKDYNNQMLEILNTNNENLTIIFTVCYEKLSKKAKISKEFQDKCKVIEIPELTDKQIFEYVEKKFQSSGKEISNKDINYFLSQIPNDLVVINNEIQKLSALNNEKITRKVIDDNLTRYAEVDIFKLSDYFINDEVSNFIHEFKNYIDLNNDFINLIYLLASNISFTRDCLILKKQHKSEKEIAELLKAHPYRVKMVLQKNNKLDIEALNDKILILYNLNNLLVNGQLNSEIISEIELLKTMKGVK